MYYDGFHRSFCDTDDLETVHESDCIFAFETPEKFRPEGILSQRGEWRLRPRAPGRGGPLPSRHPLCDAVAFEG